MNLAVSVSTSSSTVNSPIASKSPGVPKGTLSNMLVKYSDARDRNHDAASSSHGRQKDAFLDESTGKPVATEEDREHWNFPEDSESTGQLVAPGTPGNSGDSGDLEIEGNDEDWPHNLLEEVFSIVRQRYGRSPTDQKKELGVNTAIWSFFMSVTQQAAVHLGKDYTENLRSTKNQPLKSLKQLFLVTERLITDQTEITGLTTIDWQQPIWRETTLLTDRAVHFAAAETFVFSDSVLCLRGISDEPVEAWEFLEARYLEDVDRIDGGQMEFELKIFPVFTKLGMLDEVQKMMTESTCEPEQFKGRLIFMSMYNDIDRTRRGNKENCIANALRVTECARRFTQGHWSFLVPGSEKKWYGTHADKADGEWDKTAEGMMLNFAESGHPVFRTSSAQERREIRSKGKGVTTIHFNSGVETIELILRTVISVNELQYLRSSGGFL